MSTQWWNKNTVWMVKTRASKLQRPGQHIFNFFVTVKLAQMRVILEIQLFECCSDPSAWWILSLSNVIHTRQTCYAAFRSWSLWQNRHVISIGFVWLNKDLKKKPASVCFLIQLRKHCINWHLKQHLDGLPHDASVTFISLFLQNLDSCLLHFVSYLYMDMNKIDTWTAVAEW